MDLEGLVLEAKTHAIENGVLKKSSKPERMVDIIQFTLWPTQFPKKQFDFLTELQTDFNLLIDGISQNKRLLLDSLQQWVLYTSFIVRYLGCTYKGGTLIPGLNKYFKWKRTNVVTCIINRPLQVNSLIVSHFIID